MASQKKLQDGAQGKDVFETALEWVHRNPEIIGTVVGGLAGRRISGGLGGPKSNRLYRDLGTVGGLALGNATGSAYRVWSDGKKRRKAK